MKTKSKFENKWLHFIMIAFLSLSFSLFMSVTSDASANDSGQIIETAPTHHTDKVEKKSSDNVYINRLKTNLTPAVSHFKTHFDLTGFNTVTAISYTASLFSYVANPFVQNSYLIENSRAPPFSLLSYSQNVNLSSYINDLTSCCIIPSSSSILQPPSYFNTVAFDVSIPAFIFSILYFSIISFFFYTFSKYFYELSPVDKIIEIIPQMAQIITNYAINYKNT